MKNKTNLEKLIETWMNNSLAIEMSNSILKAIFKDIQQWKDDSKTLYSISIEELVAYLRKGLKDERKNKS